MDSTAQHSAPPVPCLHTHACAYAEHAGVLLWLPTTRRDQLPGMLQAGGFDWVAITSPEAATVFLEGWRAAGSPEVCVHGVCVTCVCTRVCVRVCAADGGNQRTECLRWAAAGDSVAVRPATHWVVAATARAPTWPGFPMDCM